MATHLKHRSLRRALLLCALAACSTDEHTTADEPAAAPTAERLARAQQAIKPGSVVQRDAKRGVPTFVWTRGTATARTAALTATAAPEVAASRDALTTLAPLYGLTDADVASAAVTSIHDRGTGPVIVQLAAKLGGIEIFGERVSVVLDRKLAPIAVSGYLTSASSAATTAFALDDRAGAIAALATLSSGKYALGAAQLVARGTRDGYASYDVAASAKVPLDELIRVKPVYYHGDAGLEPAYYVEVSARTGAPRIERGAASITADGDELATPEAHAYVVSAVTGAVRFDKNLIADARGHASQAGQDSNALATGGFTYRVWADPVTGIPYDTPAGNDVDPKVNPTPDGVQATFLDAQDVTLPNFPFSKNDPWLADGATETVGNNVDAFLNLLAPDGYGTPTTTTPTDPATADFRAQITAPGQFLHRHVPDTNTWLAEGRQGSIQQLFYNINFLHDWYYDAGFDEAAGNAQTNNFGRGGLGNDSIKAQVQDYAGFNNANMLTPADGSQPRMRMYVFPSPANMLELQAPASIAGKTNIGISMSGPQGYDVTAEIVKATFSSSTTGCAVTNVAALAGKLALFDFDNTDGTGCSFSTRIARLTTGTTAQAILMTYTSGSPAAVANITGYVAANTMPVATIAWNVGQVIKAQLATGVTARLYRAPDRDGALDQQIVFHEFFHYVSNRLVGNGSGLNSNQSAGMGEGWSDFSSMLLTARAEDTQVASNATWNGVYAMASYATSGVPYNGALNQGYYFGIRRYPYSTDMTKNPLTFKHITNGVALPVGPPLGFGADGASNAEVHNTGEVWTTMLWECYAGLLRDTQGASPRLTFAQAQDRMKQYVIGALKVTPNSPSFTEARDALLAVALANDIADYVVFRVAFAKRGAGAHAQPPTERFGADNAGVVEDFSVGPDVAFEGATLDDSGASCDNDGVLDHGEYGTLTVKLRNTGTTTLSETTAVISTTSNDVWFPDGKTLTFASTTPGATATAKLRVAYVQGAAGIQQLDFAIDYGDPQLTARQAATASFRANTDEQLAKSATDDVEGVLAAATTGYDATYGNVAPWQRLELTPLEHAWHADDPGSTADQYLLTPVFTVDAGGSLGVAFDHSWSFEYDTSANYDGGVLEIAVNGGSFTDLDATLYNGTIATYSGDTNPLKGRKGFIKASAGTVHAAVTKAVTAGSTVQLRFRIGGDEGGGAAGWTVDHLAFTGVVETPFSIVVADDKACHAVPSEADLGVTITDGATDVLVGGTTTYTIVASNGGPDDITGAKVSDAFPAAQTCAWTCAASAGATCHASGSGPIADTVDLASGATATYTVTCAVADTAVPGPLTHSAAIALGGVLAGHVTDPNLANNAASDVDQVRRQAAMLTGEKTVTGTFTQGGTVTYAIALTNSGPGAQLDNAGDELSDTLPAGLALVSATATSGTAVATVATNKVAWNGAIAAGGSVTVTITATITATAGTRISNQATFAYDSDGDGSNDANGTTDAYVCPATP